MFVAPLQAQNTWVSGGDTTGIVHNAIRIKGKFVSLIPPTDNQILKYDSSSDSLLYETDAGGLAVADFLDSLNNYDGAVNFTQGNTTVSADSMATAYGDFDWDALFPTSVNEFLIDTLGVVSANSDFYILARGTGRIILQDSVGIGTTTPEHILHLSSTTAPQIGITHTVGADSVVMGVDGNGLFTVTTVDGGGAAGHIILAPDGNVGIGLTDPDVDLEISSTGTATIKITGNSDASGTDDSVIQFQNQTVTQWTMGLDESGGNIFAIASAATVSAFGEIAIERGSANAIYIEADGDVGISGEANPAFDLDVAGDFRVNATVDSAFVVTSSGTIYMEGLGSGTGTQLSRVANTNQIVEETSSRRFKDNVKDWEPNIDLFMNLNPRQFDWNENSAIEGHHDYGLIAEEVAEIVPEAIFRKDGKINSYSSNKMIAYLISVVQNQQKQIDELKRKVK